MRQIMIFDDIEQKQAMFAAIIHSSEDAIISKNLDSKITSWNGAAERMFGYSENEVIGKNIRLIIPKDRWSEEEMIISSLKKGKQIDHYETVRLTKSGDEIDISLTISPIRNTSGTIIGASKIVRDITRQKQQGILIDQYVKRLELINSVGQKIVSQLDVPTILQTVTDATTKLSGAAFGAFFYNKIDVKGEAYMLYALSGAPRDAFEKFGMPRNTEVFKATFNGEGIVRSDNIKKDPRYGKNSPHHGMPKGHLPVVSYLAVPVKSHKDIVIGGLFFGHPNEAVFKEEHEVLVSALASQAGIALDNAKLYEEVQALNGKKDEFIGFASHELKTPLTTIKGYIQLLNNDPQHCAEFLPKVEKQVIRLEGIISDLLDISKIQAGKLDLNFSKISLSELIKGSIETVDAENHIIGFQIPDQDIIITVDILKISQVLINLISNAIKYSPQGSRIFLTGIQFGDEIQISVEDSGIGIPSHHLDKIFNQFYRIKESNNQKPGVGLGLYISKEIIDGHLGKIWAESEEGKGSTFHISFPVERQF
ncbi:MAG: ATP-binding protein [Chitinophagaceae bacterium]